VNDYLGRDAFSASAADLTLRVQVERRADRSWRALVQIVDLAGVELGERELTSESTLCSSLDEPLKLTVALMVDNDLVATAEPEAPPQPAAPLPLPEKKAAGEPWTLAGDASVLVQTGLLPSLSVGFQLGLELSPLSWLSLRGTGAGFLPGSTSLARPAEAKMSIIYGELSVCPSAALGAKFRLLACAGTIAGTLFAETQGLEGARSTKRRVFAASLGGRAVAQLSPRWALLAQIGTMLPYRPERFVYEIDGRRIEFFRIASPSLIAGIGCSVMF
jgi:hypothetical protein